jgi:STE24 endopeptidase
MNTYFILIISCVTFVFILDTLTDLLNWKHLQDKLPSEFVGTYDPEKYKDSIRYQKEGVQFEFVRRTFSFVMTLLFLYWGGFNFIDQFARNIGMGPIWTGLVFVGSLVFLRFVSQLPFSIYDTFVIEEKFGFNRTTPKTFVLDMIKGAILGSILGGLIFSGIVYFFEKAGPSGWLYSWIAITLFQLTLLYLAPALIMPLFNKFAPLQEGPLRNQIEAYARKRNFQLQGVYTMDSSKRSTKSNAFFTGFGKFRRLVLFDTLIEKHSVEELVAVVAHEVGHFELKHIIKSILLSIITSGILFYTFGIFLNNRSIFDAFQMQELSVYASVVFVGFLYGPILRILSIFTQKLSRKHEFEADDFAVKTYGHPETLISALKKLSRDNLSHLTPHPLKVLLDYTHPPILERIQALRKKVE